MKRATPKQLRYLDRIFKRLEGEPAHFTPEMLTCAEATQLITALRRAYLAERRRNRKRQPPKEPTT